MKEHRFQWLPAALAAAFVVACAVSVTQYVQAARYRTMIENMYQRSYYELVGGMGALEINLSKLLVSDAPDQSGDLLHEVSRQAEGVQQSLASLPLSHAALSETVRFVNQTGDYAASLGRRVAAGQPLTAQQRDSLAGLMARCGALNEVLADVDPTNQALYSAAQPQEAYYAQAQQQGQGQGMPLENLAQPKDEYPALLYDGPFSDAAVDRAPKGYLGPDITQDEAMALAIAFYGRERVQEARAAEEAFGPVPSWGVELVSENGVLATCHVAQQGGRIHWLMRDPAVYETRMSVEDLMAAGKAFLYNRGYGDMTATYAQVYSGVCTVNYAAVQDGVVLYPDLIKLQLSMQDGAVVGIEAGNWLVNHVRRELPLPAITAAEAEQRAGANMSVQRALLCLMPKPGGAESMAWECLGTKDGEEYLVYIDAFDARELNILKVIHTEGGQLTM